MDEQKKLSSVDRIKLFITYLRISTAEFERKTGLSNGYLRNIKDNISTKKLLDISLVYPQLNSNWVITGEGEMLTSSTNISDSPVVVEGSNNTCNGNNINSNEVIIKLIDQTKLQFEEKDKQIDRLLSIIEKMQGL